MRPVSTAPMETERGRKINKVYETSLGPKGILLGGIAPSNNNINSSRRI